MEVKEDTISADNMFDINAKEYVLTKIKNKDYSNIFDNLCKVVDDVLYIDYTYFKYLANETTYDVMDNIILLSINTVLSKYPTFTVHVNMKLLSITDINKHINFIKYICQKLSVLYPDKLHKVYIYNAVFIFSKAFGLIKNFLDIKTQEKIYLVDKK